MITEKVARYVASTAFNDLPGKVVDKTRMCILDWLGCVFAAVDGPATAVARELVKTWGGSAQSRVAGLPEKVPAPNAALVNGIMAHEIEYDDIYKDALYHPGAPVIAGAFAAADLIDAPGSELVRAVTLGYEVSNRLGAAINPSHYKFWHTTGTVGAFGAAVAASVLLKLDRSQTIECLGLAGTQAAGLWQSGGTMGKPLHAGKAAMNGVLAALLVKEGFRGPERIIEAEKGFAAATAGEFNPQVMLDGLGREYTIVNVTHKYYPSCGHTHAAVDAALGACQLRIKQSDIMKIKVETYQAGLSIAGNPSPGTPYEAKFSIPYCVAAALKYGCLTLGEFTENKLFDPEIRRLMANSSIIVDGEIEARFPGKRGARVTISTPAGEFTHTVSCRRGDPENPLTWPDVINKFSALAGSYLNQGDVEAVKELVLNIDRLPRISLLTDRFVTQEDR